MCQTRCRSRNRNRFTAWGSFHSGRLSKEAPVQLAASPGLLLVPMNDFLSLPVNTVPRLVALSPVATLTAPREIRHSLGAHSHWGHALTATAHGRLVGSQGNSANLTIVLFTSPIKSAAE